MKTLMFVGGFVAGIVFSAWVIGTGMKQGAITVNEKPYKAP